MSNDKLFISLLCGLISALFFLNNVSAQEILIKEIMQKNDALLSYIAKHEISYNKPWLSKTSKGIIYYKKDVGMKLEGANRIILITESEFMLYLPVDKKLYRANLSQLRKEFGDTLIDDIINKLYFPHKVFKYNGCLENSIEFEGMEQKDENRFYKFEAFYEDYPPDFSQRFLRRGILLIDAKEKLLKQLTIYGENLKVIEIHKFDYKALNSEIEDRFFQIDLPENVEVIDTTDSWRQGLEAYRKVQP